MEHDRRIQIGDHVMFPDEETWRTGKVVEIFPLAARLRKLPGNERTRNYQILFSDGKTRYRKLCDTRIFRREFLDANGIPYMVVEDHVIFLHTPETP